MVLAHAKNRICRFAPLSQPDFSAGRTVALGKCNNLTVTGTITRWNTVEGEPPGHGMVLDLKE